MELLFEDENIKVSVVVRDAPTVTLCFTGIGHSVGGIDVQSEEFHNASEISTSFFIVDKRRSWGNLVDFQLLADIVAPYAQGKVINSIGNSMGGFLAILASRFFKISAAVAFVPQFSVSRRVVPSEDRWGRYVKKIRLWRFESLHNAFLPATQYYIIAGVGGVDDRQLRMFPTRPNVHKIYFTGEEYVHNIAAKLKSDGLLYPVISDCFKLKVPSAIVESTIGGHAYGVFPSMAPDHWTDLALSEQFVET